MQANEEARLLIEQKNRQLLEQDVQLEKQRHQNARQGGEVSSIQRSLEERARDIERLQKEVDELRRCLAESEERLQQTVAQVKTLAGSLDDVYASQSWRITQPLRMVYDMLRLSGRRGP
jgi:predicted  nucleic acid-binding Zn-ribbon protein